MPQTKTHISERRMVPLYFAAFFFAACLSVWGFAMPFIMVKYLGGSNADLGWCWSLQMICYVVVCSLAGPILHRFDNKRLALAGAAGTAVMGAAMMAVIVGHGSGGLLGGNSIVLMTVGYACAGLAMAFYWPCVMGWVSTGCEGALLNRRLGFHNIGWSLAGIFGPYVGGVLLKVGAVWPLAVGIALTGMAFIAVSRVPGLSSGHRSVGAGDGGGIADQPYVFPASHARFRWISRIALLTAFVAVGAIRPLLPLLLNIDLGYSEQTCGLAMTILGVAVCVMFYLVGKIPSWHYHLGLFIVGQLAILISVVVISLARGLAVFMAMVILFGAGQAFIYASHVFYGVSGSKKRSGLMALHEMILGVGVILGSGIGGYLSDHFNRRSPYWFCAAVLVVGLVAQVIVWYSLKKQNEKIKR